MRDNIRICELNWMEYARRLHEEAPVVMLPVGSLEQHGPHLPMNCDSLIPTSICEAVAARNGGLVAPTINYGYKSQPKSGGGNHFPGTTSLDAQTLIFLVRDVIKEFARHGVRKMALMDGHYENNMFLVEAIDLALRELRRDGIDDLRIAKLPYWEYASQATLDKAFPDGFPGWPLEHAGVMETSMMLHLHPELVNMDEVPMHPPADFPLHDMYPYDPATVPASGALSSAAAATAEKGKMFMDEYIAGAAEALDEAFAQPEKIIILDDRS
ncbi:MAG: creatininase [Proteobacteria bacterium]|nr:creatininase [Pseudomonadota bacterium]MDA1356181.1 creatininase [Pseudomonadota bacterium]